jgi:hypothetical protein
LASNCKEKHENVHFYHQIRAAYRIVYRYRFIVFIVLFGRIVYRLLLSFFWGYRAFYTGNDGKILE